MAFSFFLAFLFLAPAMAVTLRADSQCPACGVPPLDLKSQRELLLNLAKKSILDKLHLSQRPTLSRPVSRAALRTALQRLRGPPQGNPLEDDREQEYEIISFAKTGEFLVCSSAPNSNLSRKGKVFSPTFPLTSSHQPSDSQICNPNPSHTSPHNWQLVIGRFHILSAWPHASGSSLHRPHNPS
jgi:hypothetical protein